ncbi:hypothetical protein FOCC_FOCC014096 [Frankliniella occidentalis]|nr:hypothetical protein FOCC_FOCC014096 [Frankliniella occidentalis]
MSELPDVAAPRCNGRLPLSHSHIHLGYPDSASSCSSKDSAPEARGGRVARFKPWCVCLLVCAVCLALIFAIAMPLTLRGAKSLATHEDRLDLVRRLLKEVPLIDG